MIKVGVTGGIGSGKSMVCKIFETLQIPVFYADLVAKEIAVNDLQVVEQIKQNFGKNIYTSQGELNRKILSEIVFNSESKLQLLNQIIHPAVAKAFNNFENKNNNAPYIVKEAAILIESGAYKNIDKIIVITAPLKQRIERVMKRDGVLEQDVLQRISKQFPEEKLIQFAHFVVNNKDGAMLLPQIIEIHRLILNEPS
ncbi:MAG: dephospho-CoA kinase [Flavobacteriales bacterium]|nr:dephospho-CoA kinase [Flavobacteriales bacterium]